MVFLFCFCREMEVTENVVGGGEPLRKRKSPDSTTDRGDEPLEKKRKTVRAAPQPDGKEEAHLESTNLSDDMDTKAEQRKGGSENKQSQFMRGDQAMSAHGEASAAGAGGAGPPSMEPPSAQLLGLMAAMAILQLARNQGLCDRQRR